MIDMNASTKSRNMKYACAMLLLALATPLACSASTPRITPLPALLAKPVDKAEPWKSIDKDKAGAPAVLIWRKP